MAENENTGPDVFVRSPDIDYSAADAAIHADAATAEADNIGTPDASTDVGDPLQPTTVSSEAVRFHEETLAVVQGVDPEGARDLVARWGSPDSESFAENWGYARHASEQLSSPALMEVLNGAGLGDHPIILQLAADIGRRMSAGSGNQGLMDAPRTPQNNSNREQINRELSDLTSLISTDPDKYKRPETQRRVDTLTRAWWAMAWRSPRWADSLRKGVPPRA